jgi:hypothetical protein
MYTTEEKIKDYLGISTLPSPLSSARITEYISAVKSWIDSYCGREFEQESASSKLYDGDGSNEILVDDILSLTKIEILDENKAVETTITSSDDYYLYPANKTPKTKIIINKHKAGVSRFPIGFQNVKITGTFGYAISVPEDIRLAATKLVSSIIEDKYIQEVGDIKSESLGEYSVTVQDIDKRARTLGVYDILDRYRIIKV